MTSSKTTTLLSSNYHQIWTNYRGWNLPRKRSKQVSISCTVTTSIDRGLRASKLLNSQLMNRLRLWISGTYSVLCHQIIRGRRLYLIRRWMWLIRLKNWRNTNEHQAQIWLISAKSNQSRTRSDNPKFNISKRTTWRRKRTRRDTILTSWSWRAELGRRGMYKSMELTRLGRKSGWTRPYLKKWSKKPQPAHKHRLKKLFSLRFDRKSRISLMIASKRSLQEKKRSEKPSQKLRMLRPKVLNPRRYSRQTLNCQQLIYRRYNCKRWTLRSRRESWSEWTWQERTLWRTRIWLLRQKALRWRERRSSRKAWSLLLSCVNCASKQS